MAIIPSGNSTTTPGPIRDQVICTRTNWYDVLWFFFGNYILHALSVRSLPGENLLSSVVFKFCCLFIPYTGLRRGLCLISRASNLDPDRLQAAARANALCMVIRNEEWRPKNGEVVPYCKLEKEEPLGQSHVSSDDNPLEIKDAASEKEIKTNEIGYELNESPSTLQGATNSSSSGNLAFKVTDFYEPIVQRGVLGWLFRKLVQTYRFRSLKISSGKRLDVNTVKIHGLCKLPPGYSVSLVPEDVKVFPRRISERPTIVDAVLSRNLTATTQALISETKLSTANNVPRILFSLMQTVSGAFSLYRAQGSQIERFGYTAYGLTVLPYMIVSVFNILGSLLTSEYEMLYMVRSNTMDEMIQRGGAVDGVVGSLDEPQGEINQQYEPVEQSGTSIEFEEEGDKLRFRDVSIDAPYSDPLAIVPLCAPKPHNIHTAFYKIKWFDKRKAKKEKRRKAIEQAETVTPTTVITIPSHSSIVRIPTRFYQSILDASTVVLLVLAFAVPYLVNYGLTKFKANHATSNYKSFIINWLVEGTVMGYVVGSIEKLNGNSMVVKGMIIMFLSYGCYCIQGFVAVVQQMIDLGMCTAV